MAKVNVSARVPPNVAEGIDEFAETWNMTRTEAMTVILREGLQCKPSPQDHPEDADLNPTEGVYTVELDAEAAEEAERVMEENDEDFQDIVDRLVKVYF